MLTNSPGVNLRISMLRIPGRGFGFELTEFTNTERTPRQFKLTDPGAPHMKFLVKDIDAVVAAAKQRGATIISTGGAPADASVSVCRRCSCAIPTATSSRRSRARVRLRWTPLATSWVP